MTYNVEFTVKGLYSVDDIEAESMEEAIDIAKEIVNCADFGSLWDADIESCYIESEEGECESYEL